MELLYNYHEAFFKKGAAQFANALRTGFFPKNRENTEGGYFVDSLRKIALLTLILATCLGGSLQAQVANAPANTISPLINGTFTGLAATKASGGSGNAATEANLIDASLTNFATVGIGLQLNVFATNTASLRVEDNTPDTYPIGTFVGFKYELAAFSDAKTVTFKTYLGATARQTVAEANLIDMGNGVSGFYTTQTFDAIEFNVAGGGAVALAGTYNVYYPVIMRNDVAGAALNCNAPTILNFDGASPYPVKVINTAGVVSNPYFAINGIGSDVTTISKADILNGGAQGKYSVRDLMTDYAATVANPIFVGFITNNVSDIRLTPYLNGTAGTVVNPGDATFTIINTPNGSAVGILMTTPFDELQIETTFPTALGAVNIEGFVVSKTCTTTNAPLLCNTAQILESGTDKALIVNGNRTTWDKIGNASNALTAGADFTRIDPGALSVVRYSVKDLYNDYTPQVGKLGIFVGFDMQNQLLNVLSLTGNVTIKTYLDGTLVQTATNAQILEEENAAGRRNVGFRATQAFDEVQIELASGLNLTDPKEIYGLVLEQVCQSPDLIDCVAGVSTPNTITTPEYLVQIKSEASLIGGGAVTNLNNLVNASTTDFATMGSSLGLLANVSVVVKDKATIYPAGTFAGFEIISPEVVADSFRSLNFTTYLNGVKQEDTYVLNLGIIKNSENSRAFRAVDTATSRATVGILASKPFDEIKMTYQHDNLLGLNTWQPLKVYKTVLEKTCPITLTDCNVPKPLTFPQSSVFEYSFMGGGCLTTILGEGALSTPNPNDYVTFVGGLSVGCTRFIGLKNAQGVPFPTGSFVGFETETLTAVGLTIANVSFVETWLNGVKQESKTFVSVLNTTTVGGGRSIIGFKTDAAKPFDEIRFVKIGAADAEIGVTNIYNGFIQKTCPVDLVCNKPTFITTANATVTHDSYKTPLVSIYPVNGLPQVLPAAGCNGFLNNVEALVTPSKTDFASIINIQALGCSQWLEVRDWGTLYPAGTYIGVDIEQGSLVSLAVGDLRTVETYLDNKLLPEEILVVSGGLASAGILSAGRQMVGAVATKPFNRVRYSQSIALAVAQGVVTKVYGIMALAPCAGAPLTCTTPNANPGTEGDFERLNNPPTTNTNASTDKGRAMTLNTNPSDDILGISVCSNIVLNSENAISDDVNDFASITLTGVLCAASFTFNNLSDTFPAGHFVGVEIENTNFVSANLLGGVTVETYLNGVKQETVSGLGLGALEIGSNGRRKIGFVNTKTFNSIKYFQGQVLGVSLGVTKLYGAVVRKLCAGAPLVCNQKTILNAPNFPTGAVVGQSGGCISGITNQHALSSNDTTDYASFTSGLNILCDRYVGIKDFVTTYPAGTYAGFDVRFTAVVELALNQYKIETWKNGVKQETSDAAFAVSYGLYAGNVRFPVGFKTTMDFDEIRFVVKSGASASLAGVDVFNAFVMNLCEPTLACNKTYNLTPSGATSFPIVVDGTKSGITGACLGCYVKDAENILSASTTDYAEIGMFLSALNEAKIAVKNPQTTYPTGTRVGFTYQNVNGIFDAALFNATTVRTFLNGVQQESKSSTNLLEVPILTNWSAPAIKNIGFTTTMPFDEIQLAFSNTTGTFRVYGAFIDTRSSTAGSGPLAACVCNAGDVAPILSATTLNNGCPITTVDLSSITASNKPVGTVLTWHTDTIADISNKVTDSTLVAVSGKYYGAFYDGVNGCYSLATTPVGVAANSCVPFFTFDCGSATSTGTFTANNTAGQTGTLIVPITSVAAGSATFTVTGTGFTGTLSTLIAANQASVSIPIIYNGTGAVGSRVLTVTSSQGIGACTPSVSVVAGGSGASCLLSLPVLLPLGLQLPILDFCVLGNYNYYKELAAGLSNRLAINPNGNTFNPTSIIIDASNAGTHTLTSGGKTTALANRMISVVAPGSYTTNGGLKVRIYYDSTEFAGLPTARRTWFKHPASSKAALLAALTATGLPNMTALTPSSTGTENGVTYVEFENITSFSTFGYMGTSAASFNFDCGTSSSTGTFTANATAGQTGTLVIPMTNATAGTATFTVTGTGFTGSLSTTLTAGQTSVSIPITYDGTGAAGSRMLTMTSSEGTGSCTPSVSVAAAVTCATPTVGGTAAYSGSTLCDASNIGTAMLTGQTGDIVRWETSTNSGGSWSPITSTNTYYNFANAANGQQYRAVLNNGSGCLDANSAAATIATSATNCTSTTCDNTTGNITFTVVTPPSNANLKTHIIMTNSSGVIQYASQKDSVKINGVAVGDYLVYRVVYDSTQLPLPTLTVGTNITAIGGGCTKFTNQLAYKVCPAPSGAPDLITTIGQPMPTLSVGQPSNLPITVANIGTASAPGIITTTITLPIGVTAPATFTSNNWTCSTTAPTVTCTNPGSLAAGRDSTFFVPITPNASLSGTTPTFNATTNPVTGETVTSNNAATPTTTTIPVVGGSLLTMKVLLQGNYDPNTGWMHDSLRKKGLIPTSDPYRTAAYSTKFVHKKNGATQTTTAAILAVTGANAIVDWVFVELHSAANPATVITTKAALLQRDGDIVSSDDGISPVLMDSVASGNYYIAIRHRNHLGTMTATTRSLSATSTVVDFTALTAAQLWNKAGGDGYEQTKAGIRNLLWAGDTDGNRQTVFSGPTNDVDPVFFDVMTNVANVNFVPNYIVNTQYLASDVNLDGKVIYQSADNEVDIILFMVLSHTLNTGFIPSYIVVEQLP